MFRIAKNLVKSLEQSVQDTLALSQNSNQLDAFFQSIPPNLLLPQLQQLASNEDNQGGAAALGPRMNETVAGLRVIYVEETQLQLQSYFDYIVGINDEPLPVIYNQHGYHYPDYKRIVALFNDKCSDYIKLNVWSAKGGNFRDEYISVSFKDESKLEDISLQSTDHSTDNDVLKAYQPLGFKIQWSPLLASTFTYHILNLNLTNGPADMAGLIPDEDYIIGCQDGLLATGGETLLQDIVRSRTNHELVLYVYNKVHDCVRPITVHIGGDGRLGCNVGYGFLHRIPTVVTREIPESEQPQPELSESAFVPTAFSGQTTAPPPTSTKKKLKPVKINAGANVMGSYFNEGKDDSSRTPNTDGIAPPPTKQK